MIFSCLLIACSCASEKHKPSTVLNKATNLPVDSVRVWTIVNNENNNMEILATYSDSNGVFSAKEMMEWSKQCPTVTLIFEKEGYNTTSVVFRCNESLPGVFLEPK
jgi:hypothetical protein